MIPPQLAKIGVDVKISQMEFLQRYTDLTNKNYQGMIYGSGIPATNWDSYTFGWIHSTSKTNFYFIDDPEVDKIIDEARTSFDKAKQIDQFKKLFAMADDNLYRLNLTTPYYFSAWHDYMENASSGTYVWITSWVSRGKERIWFKEGYPQ